MCFAWLLELQTWIGWSRALVGGCASYCLQIYRDNNTVLPVLSTDHNNAGGNLSISLLEELREENRLIYFFTERATRGPVFSSNTFVYLNFMSLCHLIYVLASKTDIKSAAYTQKLTNKHLLRARVIKGYSKLKERNHRPIVCKCNRGKFHLLSNILTKRILFLG